LVHFISLYKLASINLVVEIERNFAQKLLKLFFFFRFQKIEAIQKYLFYKIFNLGLYFYLYSIFYIFLHWAINKVIIVCVSTDFLALSTGREKLL